MIDLTVKSGTATSTLSASALTIDFYKTLATVDLAQPKMFESLTSWGYPCDERTELRFNSEGCNGELTPAGPDYDTWRLDRITRLCETVGVPPAEAPGVADTLIKIDQSWTVKPLDGANELLDVLLASGTPFVILTNWDYALEPYLEQAGFPRTLATLTSRQAGARKPHTKIFTMAAAMMDTTTGIVHLGDRWDCDVEGALAAGWTPCWLTTRDTTTDVPYVPDLPFLLGG